MFDKSTLFMQNKANFRNDKIDISSFVTSKYEIFDDWRGQKTNPIQTQFKANLTQNKPNLTQFQSQTNPILSEAKVLSVVEGSRKTKNGTAQKNAFRG
jgi:hypothetical protein